MTVHPWWCLAICLIFGCVSAQGQDQQSTPTLSLIASAPRVVYTWPVVGTRDVDPLTTQVVVQFDSMMSDGRWSWCGGGRGYPELTASPYFRDAYTAVLPVRLQPEHTYALSINCPSAQGFRSREGIPAVIHPIRFTTGPGDAMPVSNMNNYRALQELRRLMRDRYSHYARTGTDWDAQFEDATEFILRAPDAVEWAMRCAEVLSLADDPHLYLRDGDGTRISTHRRRGVLNANPASIRGAFTGWREFAPTIRTARRGAIGYMALDSWDAADEARKAADDATDSIMDTEVLILDMRANGGGDEPSAQRLARRFLDRGGIYARHRYRDPDAEGGWSAIRTRALDPGQAGTVYRQPILVLQGSVCLSSNEAFLLMMRLNPRATFIGEPSGGSSGNPRRYDLPNGLVVTLPSWQSLRPDGTPFEGTGLAPDILVTGDFTRHDPVLDEAIRRAESIAKSKD